MNRLIVLFLIVTLICATIAVSSGKKLRRRKEDKKNASEVAGTVIDGASLAFQILDKVLTKLDKVRRKIAIGIDNESGESWKAMNAYFRSGTTDVILPDSVPNGKALVFSARKDTGPVATGAVGALAYHLKDGNTLGVMFSVPSDYNLYSNWWGVKVFRGKRKADHEMYEALYSDSPFKGDDGWHKKNLEHGLKMTGTMTSAGEAKLQIKISR